MPVRRVVASVVRACAVQRAANVDRSAMREEMTPQLNDMSSRLRRWAIPAMLATGLPSALGWWTGNQQAASTGEAGNGVVSSSTDRMAEPVSFRIRTAPEAAI